MRPSRRRRLDGQSPGLPNQNEAGFIGETAASSALTAPHHPKSRILQQLMTSPPDPLTFCPKKLPLPRPRFLSVPTDAVAGSAPSSKSSLFVAAQDWRNRRTNNFFPLLMLFPLLMFLFQCLLCSCSVRTLPFSSKIC